MKRDELNREIDKSGRLAARTSGESPASRIAIKTQPSEFLRFIVHVGGIQDWSVISSIHITIGLRVFDDLFTGEIFTRYPLI